MSIANKDNFYMGTEANFKKANKPNNKADYISASGSQYWYTEKGVFRFSDHWGSGINTCNWYLKDDAEGFKCGYCSFKNFKLVREFKFDVYVKNYEFFDKFEYDEVFNDIENGSKLGAFEIKVDFDNMKNNCVNFYGRRCTFDAFRSMSIKFDY